MSDPVRAPMTSIEFIARAMEQPAGQRFELVAGKVIGMAPERGAHALTEFHIARRLAEAAERNRLACTVYPDGMAVEIDQSTLYEPDALVRCGPGLSPDAVKVTDPVIVVEVLSLPSKTRDSGAKRLDYFRLPSVQHYLIVRTEDKAVIHHARNPDGTILTRIARDGTLHLDPPGLPVTGLFPEVA